MTKPSLRTREMRAAARYETTHNPSLTSLDIAMLEELSRTRVTLSSVSLAVDLVDRGALERHGDPFGLVVITLEHLNELDLVTYKLSAGGVPTQIRLTETGYNEVGLGMQHWQVGSHAWASRHREPPQHPSDRTDFRTHDTRAAESFIERMPLAMHCEVYHDHAHLHSEQLAEMEMLRHERSNASRTSAGQELALLFAYASSAQERLDLAQRATLPELLIAQFYMERVLKQRDLAQFIRDQIDGRENHGDE